MSKIVLLFLVVLLMVGMGWSQDHDLVIEPAPDVTSSTPANWKSPDLKIGADFGDASVPNIVQRGVDNHLYARFYINGMQDHTIPSGDVQVKFYWRNASIGDTPPALTDPGWTYIDRLLVTYITADGPFAITRTWPTDFPSVTTKYVTWNAPASGSYFHIAAEIVYPAGITDANPGDNVAVSLYESRAGLLDVVLLHDVSGSMGYYTYGGYTYFQQAISKASMFLASMPEVHRFCVVAFSSKYSGGYEDVWPTSMPMLQEATDVPPTNNKSSAIAALSGLSATGATPLGEGLEQAIQILTTPLEPDRKRVIILLSDGYENAGTPKACSGVDPASPCVGGTLLSQLQTNNIKVFSISLGTSAWTECLECLASQSGGQWYSSPTASLTLAKVYLDILQDSTSDDLYRVDKGISGGGDDTYSTYFEGVDNVLYFMLSWDDLDANLDLKLRPPTRSRINSKVYKDKGYMVIKVKNPRRGIWRYTVTGDEGKDYLAAVRSDRVGVRLRIDAFSKVGEVGTPIEIKARLTYGKRPITNASLTAAVKLPVGPSLNTILQTASRKHILKYGTTPVNPSLLKKNPDISARSAFIKKIMGDKQKPLVKTRTVNVQLEHTGNGFYSGVLKERYTTTAGEYIVTVTGSDRRYHRNYAKQLRLKPGKIDYNKSFTEIVTVKTPRIKTPTWLMQVYARDRFGNAITDPSLSKHLNPEIKGARVSVKPKITMGTYQHKLYVYPGMKPKLDKVTLKGKVLKIKKVDRVN